MSDKVAVILGARSDIAVAVSHSLASAGYDIQLAARNVSELAPHASDLTLRYSIAASLYEFDALDIQSHEAFVDGLDRLPDVVVSAVGYLGDQMNSERDPKEAAKVIRSNFEGPASILSVFANHFEQRGHGCIVGISSVAGERGRASNYIYGSAKAAFTAYLSGLRNRMSGTGVTVVTLLPGFVRTKMTEGIDLPNLLTAEPRQVAASVMDAVHNKRSVVFVKPIWKFIMLFIILIPEKIFKNMKI